MNAYIAQRSWMYDTVDFAPRYPKQYKGYIMYAKNSIPIDISEEIETFSKCKKFLKVF
jgi:hypothetical protein